MRDEIQVTKTQYSCDGCDYLLGQDPAESIRVVVPFDHDLHNELEFHFHTLSNRSDCFRYWAHNPRIMIRSLERRALDEREVDVFLSLMLYRKAGPFSGPGIERPKEAA